VTGWSPWSGKSWAQWNREQHRSPADGMTDAEWHLSQHRNGLCRCDAFDNTIPECPTSFSFFPSDHVGHRCVFDPEQRLHRRAGDPTEPRASRAGEPHDVDNCWNCQSTMPRHEVAGDIMRSVLCDRCQQKLGPTGLCSTCDYDHNLTASPPPLTWWLARLKRMSTLMATKDLNHYGRNLITHSIYSTFCDISIEATRLGDKAALDEALEILHNAPQAPAPSA
jgi:hypothetical protein